MLVSSVDRFIPARKFINSEVASYNISHAEVDSILDVSIKPESKQLFFNTAKYANNIINYRKLLESALGLTQSHVIKCSISKKRSACNKICETKKSWPVTPRKKPLLNSPDVVLDMPDIDTTINHHVIDWGKQGQIATIFLGEVHLWMSCGSIDYCTNTDRSIENCVRWNRQGTKFAVARSNSRMSIIDAKTLKIDRTVVSKCLNCTITAIAWSKDETVVAGCSFGVLICDNKSYCHTSHFYTFFKHEIIDLKFSCNENYLLASTRKVTAILKWPITLDSMLRIFATDDNDQFTYIRSTSWHPWKESILAVGEIDNGITIWNVNNQKMVDYKITKPFFNDTCFLECLTFNPLSAELVVSFYCTDSDPDSDEGCNILTIFGDLHTRVDEMQFHKGRVPHLLWDGTGTKLATVGADENLVIWNFFGKGTTAEKKLLNQIKKKSRHNIFEISKRLHTCIR